MKALLTVDGKSWNIRLVQEIFWDAKVQTILSITPNWHGGPDKFIWGLTAEGSFSVKNVYTIALSLKIANEGKVSNSVDTLKIHEKAKHFQWRLNTNIVSTNSILFRMKVIDNVSYPIWF